MRCITCQNLSFFIICKTCQRGLLQSTFNKRELEKDFFVYSFYPYEDLKLLLNTKYEFYGDKIFSILAKLSLEKFAKNFEFSNKVYALPIDDHTRHHFSQTAILTKSLKSKHIVPIYNRLKARKKVKYAGKDLAFRKNNKRDFIYTGKSNRQVILIDDLVTTGTTILEAKKVLEQHGCEVLFALTISDARV